MKAFLGQTKLTLTLNTFNAITGATTTKIKFFRPDGSEGAWTATVDGMNLKYTFTTGDLNQAGVWRVWTYIVFNDGKISIGEYANLTIYKEGN